MPKKKLSDDEKKALFETWQAGPENTAIQLFMNERGGIKPIELGVVDISDNI